MQVVELVKLGFAGFVAAMAVLSYQLMRQELARPSRNVKIFEHIHTFARYTLLLSLIVLLGTIVDGVSKWLVNREVARVEALGAGALKCRQALIGLQGAEGQQETIVDLRRAQERANDACFATLSAMRDAIDKAHE